MLICQLVSQAKEKLSFIAENPLLEAEILLAHTLKKSRSYLHTWGDQSVPAQDVQRFTDYIERRCRQEPIAYITGRREFWSLELMVNQDTLIPRPETEVLIESVLKLFPPHHKIKVADLGTGSGAIALALGHERPEWQIYAIDNHEKALDVAQLNADRLAIKNISFCHGHWCDPLQDTDFDLIVSNPPYIAETEWPHYALGLRFEPLYALVAGSDGLDAIREIICKAQSYLKPGGYLFIEHGFSQREKVQEIFARARYQSIHSIRDLSGQERVTYGRC